MDPTLSPLHKDALRELGEVAGSSGANAGAKLARRRIVQSTAQLHDVPAREVAKTLGLEGQKVVGAATKLEGDVRGALLIAFREDVARGMADLLLARPPRATKELGAIEQSALKEFVNIVSGGYLRTFDAFLGVRARQSVPMFAIADWDPLVRYTFLGTTPGAQKVWAVASRLDAGLDAPLHALLLLDGAGLGDVLGAVDARMG